MCIASTCAYGTSISLFKVYTDDNSYLYSKTGSMSYGVARDEKLLICLSRNDMMMRIKTMKLIILKVVHMFRVGKINFTEIGLIT